MLASYDILGTTLLIHDREGSRSGRWIADELIRDDYGLQGLALNPGDVVVDVGAHVGMFSIFAALRFPEARIFAFEPDPANFANLTANLALNEVTRVVAQNLAITADGRQFSISAPATNTGGAGGFRKAAAGESVAVIRSVTLDEAFARHGIDRCALLKIDCEGAEHEILKTAGVLGRVERLSGEFHGNAGLRAAGHAPEDLIALMQTRFAPDRLSVRGLEIED